MSLGSRSEDVAGAWRDVVAGVIADGADDFGTRDAASVGSGFGEGPRPVRELFGASAVVDDPTGCLTSAQSRRVREGWIYAQWLRLMDGSDEPADFLPYQSRAYEFSDEAGRLRGAFGYRLRSAGGDQLEGAIELLRADPGSRRAFLTVTRPIDVLERPRDFPCAASIHFRLRNDTLLAMTTMRSQSALMLFPYDAALFCLLQIWVASALDVPVGPHHFSFGSLHIYRDELEVARALLEEDLRAARVGPMTHPREMLDKLLEWERADAPSPAPAFAAGTFWSRVPSALLAARRSLVA
jgi:thymidylate synthase